MKLILHNVSTARGHNISIEVDYDSKQKLLSDFIDAAKEEYRKNYMKCGGESCFEFLGFKFKTKNYYYESASESFKNPPSILTLEEWNKKYPY